MKLLFTLSFLVFTLLGQAQTTFIKGQLQDTEQSHIAFANLVLYQSSDSVMVKVETSDETGLFKFQGIPVGNYFLKATYVGFSDLTKENIQLADAEQIDLGVLSFRAADTELAEVTVTATRALVEVKPDRTVFNVEGTINSVGSDAISLLRKAPGVTVDNNNSINVLGRSGVLLYVDGKRLPLTGEDLSNYLQNLQAVQIDRIDIITNPGARYEAEGNAGIIDIRLKKDKSHGSNGSVSGTFSQGRYSRYNVNGSGNYRNKNLNAFGSLGFSDGDRYNDIFFVGEQNGVITDETNEMVNGRRNYEARFGTDFFISEKQTIGFLASAGKADGDNNNFNRIFISSQTTPSIVDSTLLADNTSTSSQDRYTFNINYRFDNRKGRSLNLDVDYGKYKNDSDRFQPNRYYNAKEDTLLTEIINRFNTPTTIDIYTFKVDYEEPFLGGKLGLGSKLSRVVSDNTFLVFDDVDGETIQDNNRSNQFDYDENVYAGYLSFTRPLGKKFNISAGLRAEQTDAVGNLQVFIPDSTVAPVDLNYLSWFPSAGLTWQVNRMNVLALNYGRRINRPDYNILNPFRNQLSQLSYEKGNPFLSPEIVNNVELGYTYAYRYNFKLAYSRTSDQITRLIGPDDVDPRAGFISWANLAQQTVFSLNISAPVQVNKWWSAYFNFSASHLDNQADYGDEGVVDVQAFTYSIYQQHTFTLPAGFKGEISGYFAGPGVWGGVFEYETSWSLDIGLQRKFLQDQLNVRLAASDLFYQTGWDGVSEFNGLISTGSGRWDSRQVSLSISYRFGNNNVKSRKRKTGLEDEAGRVGG